MERGDKSADVTHYARRVTYEICNKWRNHEELVCGVKSHRLKGVASPP